MTKSFIVYIVCLFLYMLHSEDQSTKFHLQTEDFFLKGMFEG